MYAQPWRPRLVVVHHGGNGPPDIVLLHGDHGTPAQLLSLARSLELPPAARVLLPEAPEVIAGGRVWWNLDLTAYRRPGDAGIDLTSIDPRGMERAARLVRRSLGREGLSPADPIILGGFSQGAMVACEVAFNSDEPLSALVLLSGTYVDSTGWGWKAAKRRGLPVFMAHGRQDKVFPFDQAKRLAQKLAWGQGEDGPGVEVTFVPFAGGHEIPPEVQRALALFLAQLRSPRTRALSDGVPVDAGPPAPSNVRELRNFPADLPSCASSALPPQEPGLALVGQKVTFSGTLSLWHRECTLMGCKGGCCNECWIPFQITGIGNSTIPVAVGRSLILNECEPVPSITRFVVATGVLALHGISYGPGGPLDRPSFYLQDANLCVPRPRR